MVKKKNKTLESVLLVLKALDNKISQPVVEQVLKECDGCTQKAIEILESIVIKEELAASKIAFEFEEDEQIRIGSVLSEMTSLLGPLLVEMSIFEDVIRSEKYVVEKCIERYFELIEIYGEYRAEDNSSANFDFMEEDCGDIADSATWFPTVSKAICSDQKEDQIINDIDSDSAPNTRHLERQNTIPSEKSHESSNTKEFGLTLQVDNCSEGLGNSEKSCDQLEMIASGEIEVESPVIPVTNTRDRRASEAASLDFEEEKEQIDIAMNLQNQLSIDAAAAEASNSDSESLEALPDGQQKNSGGQFIEIESVKLAKGDMQIFFGFFDGLIEEPELMSYWNKSYSDRLSDVCRGIANAVDISLVMSGAISLAVSHLEDQENDWDEILQESDVIYGDDINHGVLDDGDVFIIPSDYDEVNGNETLKCANDGLYNDTMSEGSENRIHGEHSSSPEALFETVRNVLGNQKCKYSDKFIRHALKICNNNLDRAVEFILMSQTSQALSYDPSRSTLSKYAHKKFDKLSNSTFSYADILVPKTVGDQDFPISLKEKNYNNHHMDISQYEDVNLGHYKDEFNCYDDVYRGDVSDYHSQNIPGSNNFDQIVEDKAKLKNIKQKTSVWSSSHRSRSDHDRETGDKNQKDKTNDNNDNNDDNNDYQFDSENIYYDIYGNIIFDDRDTSNTYKKNNSKSSNSENEFKIQKSRSTIKNDKNNNKGKSLQWRLVASKEGAKMKESLLKQTLQRNLPPAFAENREQYKQRLLVYGNMAAKYALEEKNPNLNVIITPSGKIEFTGFSQKRDFFNGNQNAQHNLRNGGDLLELTGCSKKVLIELFDLHGLLVREAIQFVESIFNFYGTENRVILRFIVGRGNHSIGKVLKLGPALKKYLESINIQYTVLDAEIRARINA